jgi:hypothetical protein
VGFDKKKYNYYYDDEQNSLSYEAAVYCLTTINKEIAAKTFNPADRLRSTIEARLFSAAWAAFLEEKEADIVTGMFAPSTLMMYKSHYKVWLSKISDRDIKLIDEKALKDLRQLLAIAGKHWKYQINIFATMHSFLSWCMDDPRKWLKALPKFPEYPGKPLSRSARRPSLTVEEQEVAFGLIKNPIVKDILTFEGEIGCRPGEGYLVHIEDRDRDGKGLTLKRTWSARVQMERVKEGANRHVILSSVAREIFDRHVKDPVTGLPRQEGLLFRNPDARPAWGPFTTEYLRREYRDAVGMEMPDHYSAVRTSFSTQMGQLPISEKEWKKMTHHTTDEAADRYFNPGQRRQEFLMELRRKTNNLQDESDKTVVPFKKPGQS